MALQSTRLTDGFTTLIKGVDGGEATNLLPRTQVAFAMNVSFRGGFAVNRPGLNQFTLNFLSEGDETFFTTGRFQGGEWYIPDTGSPMAFVSISGHIFRLTETSFRQMAVEDLTLPNDPNNSLLKVAWFCQAEQYMVVQNGVDAALIYDGATLRRAKPQSPFDEVPTGEAMAYGHGRLFVQRGKNFEAGDIVGGATDVIIFKEVKQFEDAFAVPITSGNITAMIFSAQLDTSLGQGELEVHTAGGDIITVNVALDRKSWTTSAIQQIGLRGAAATGQNALVNVNNDTWFRSRDGIRSYVVAWRQFGTWGNTPQSREVSNILAYDSEDLLYYASAAWFDNRLLTTVSPVENGIHIYSQGLAVLDYDLLSSIAGTIQPPAWDGVWMGVNISLISRTFFGSAERCFIFNYDPEQGNGLWELSKTSDQDYFDNGCCPIQSYIETGSMNFSPLTPIKKLIAGDLWFDQKRGSIGFDVRFKPDQYPFWVPWGYLLIPDETPGCGFNPLTNCQTPVTKPDLYGARVRLTEPDYQPDNLLVDYPLNLGYDFQFRIAWSGHARLKAFRVHGFVQDEETTGGELQVLSGPCPPDLNPNGYDVTVISSGVQFLVSRINTVTTHRYLVSDIGNIYTAQLTLDLDGAENGDIQRLVIVMPASLRPTIEIIGSAETVTIIGTGTAFQSMVVASFDGTNWNIDEQTA